MAAVDRFQKDTRSAALTACGGVGIIDRRDACHLSGPRLGAANHAQAEDRCYRLGQTSRVTVEYFLVAGTLDGYISELLEQKMKLIAAVEAEELLMAADRRHSGWLGKLGPALMESEGCVCNRRCGPAH